MLNRGIVVYLNVDTRTVGDITFHLISRAVCNNTEATWTWDCQCHTMWLYPIRVATRQGFEMDGVCEVANANWARVGTAARALLFWEEASRMVSGMLRRWRQDWYSHVRSLDLVPEMLHDLKSMSRFLEILFKKKQMSLLYIQCPAVECL